MFKKYGDMEYCYIVYEPENRFERARDPSERISRGYAFVKYFDSENSDKALAELNGFELMG